MFARLDCQCGPVHVGLVVGCWLIIPFSVAFGAAAVKAEMLSLLKSLTVFSLSVPP
jgi:hypothetical protein